MDKTRVTQWAAGLSVAAVLAAGGVGVATHADKGRMMVSQEAMDIANKNSSGETVDFYRGVCGGVNKIVDSPDKVIAMAEKSVGHDPDKAADMYRSGVRDAAGDINAGIEELKKTDSTAPTVVRVDGVETNFHGAVQNLVTAAEQERDRVNRLADNDQLWRVSTPQQVTDVAQRSVQTVGDGVGRVVKGMDSLQHAAPIYSEATLTDLQQLPVCSQIFNPDFSGDEGQKQVVDGVVDVKDAVALANKTTTRELSGLNDLSDMVGVDAKDTHAYTLRVVEAAAQVARDQADMLGKLTNPYDENKDGDKFRATNKALDFVVDGPGAYTRLAGVLDSWAKKLRDLDPADSQGFNELAENLAPQLRDAQIGQAKFTTRAMTRIPMPTQATTERFNAHDKERNADKTDHRAVEVYKAVATAQHAVADDMSSLSSATSAPTLSAGLNAIASSAETNAARIREATKGKGPDFATPEYVKKLDAFARVARTAADNAGDEAQVQRLTGARNELGKALVGVMSALPSGGATGQEIDKVRAKEFPAPQE